ncbi:MAG: Uma2 family endonuclease [Tepidisphaeraceae bacterium]
MSTIARPSPPPVPDFDKPLPRGLRMSEEEFVAWYTFPEGKAEWSDGEVFLMAPISDEHDVLQWWLRSLLTLFAKRKDLGEVRGPQFVARLTFPRGRRRAVARREPDIFFVSKKRLPLLHKNHFEGAPDLVIEIVSPDDPGRDYRVKYREYEAAGVREYWVVDPLTDTLEVHSLDSNGAFKPLAQGADGRWTSRVVTGWYLKPDWLWERPRIDVLEALAELGVR